MPSRLPWIASVFFALLAPLPLPAADVPAPAQPAYIWGPEATRGYRLVKRFTGPAGQAGLVASGPAASEAGSSAAVGAAIASTFV